VEVAHDGGRLGLPLGAFQSAIGFCPADFL
jgi:hypothetical protein